GTSSCQGTWSAHGSQTSSNGSGGGLGSSRFVYYSYTHSSLDLHGSKNIELSCLNDFMKHVLLG
ncbi:MAG: hypothetical protein K8S15_14545, partial [Candidatus Aegiribacteria sp.]|nr:hypothetical protein [Candidatus Aegiribacteria sp.]